MRTVRALFQLSVACVMLTLASSAGASTPGVLRLHLRPLTYVIDSYPMASGDYVLLSLAQPADAYAVIDDKTQQRTIVAPPDDCSMWGSAPFAVPWIVFSWPVGPGFRLYNVVTHRWRRFDCGAACANIGVTAPEAFGSRWMEVNEEAYCSPGSAPCSPDSTVFVSLPDARTGVYQPAGGRVLDLNSPSLSRTVCNPLATPAATSSLSFFGPFAVTSGSQPEYLERCGSHLHERLLGTPVLSTGTVHAIVTCTAPTGYSVAPLPSRYSVVFLPRVKHYTFSIRAGFERCGAAVDNDALSVADRTGTRVWRASFPTRPPDVAAHRSTS